MEGDAGEAGDDQTQAGQSRLPFTMFQPSATKLTELQQAHERDAAAAQAAEALRAARLVPQYETSPAQALGGAPAASLHNVAAVRLSRLSSPRTDPRIRRHLEAERRHKDAAARRNGEDDAKRARAREQAERLARLGSSNAATRSLAAAVPAEARDLLLRLIINILEAPNDVRKRKLRLSNLKLQPIAASTAARELLRHVGFVPIDEDGEPHLLLPMSQHGQRSPLENARSALAGMAEEVAGAAPARTVAVPLAHVAAAASTMSRGSAAEPKQPEPLIVCPLSLEVMDDPVITCLGNTYSREAIEAWIAACVADGRAPTDPLCGQELPSIQLIDNVAIRGAALEFLESKRRQAAPPPVPAPPAPQAPLPARAPPSAPADPQLRQLVDMGFEASESATALANADGNLEGALVLLGLD